MVNGIEFADNDAECGLEVYIIELGCDGSIVLRMQMSQ